METPQANFFGLFRLNTQTNAGRFLRLLCLPAGIGIFWFLLADTKAHHVQKDDVWLFVVFGVLMPGIMVLGGVFAIFDKPGTYFTGARLAENGVEIGKLSVPLKQVVPATDVEPDWAGHPLSGHITSGTWVAKRSIPYQDLTIVVTLKQDREKKMHFFFQRIGVVRGESELGAVSGAKAFAENHKNDLVTMVDGRFRLLGARNAFPAEQIPEALEHIASVIKAIPSAQSAKWALRLAAKTDAATTGIVTGLVGALISAASDSRSREKLAASLKRGDFFSEEVSARLIAFLEQNQWELTTG
jgi:hypothetical protein